MHKDLIVNALKERLAELRETRIARLAPERFGLASDFVAEAKEQLIEASPSGLEDTLTRLEAPVRWMEGDFDCLSSLRRVALGQPLSLRPGTGASLPNFLQDVSLSRNPEARFHFLTGRYRCPLNFSLPDEAGAREWVLMRLMVQDRALIEKKSTEAIHAEDLLLKVNLVAVHTLIESDLRFLDALNYYYELLPSAWHPPGEHDWLVVSYFSLYARALTAWISR